MAGPAATLGFFKVAVARVVSPPRQIRNKNLVLSRATGGKDTAAAGSILLPSSVAELPPEDGGNRGSARAAVAADLRRSGDRLSISHAGGRRSGKTDPRPELLRRASAN